MYDTIPAAAEGVAGTPPSQLTPRCSWGLSGGLHVPYSLSSCGWGLNWNPSPLLPHSLQLLRALQQAPKYTISSLSLIRSRLGLWDRWWGRGHGCEIQVRHRCFLV